MGRNVVMTIRPMIAADVAAIAALELTTYAAPWSERVFEDELSQNSRVYLVAEDSDGISGYAGLMLVGEDGHVTTMAVVRHRRGAGLGTRLMLRLIEDGRAVGMRNLTLEVRPSNEAAQALYRRFGLESVGMRKNYYPDEDAMIMWVHDMDAPDYAALLEEIRGTL